MAPKNPSDPRSQIAFFRDLGFGFLESQNLEDVPPPPAVPPAPSAVPSPPVAGPSWSAPPLPRGARQAALEAIVAEVGACALCRLHVARTNVVPGQGNPEAELMFIGEGPGADEDAQGLAFVGKAGQLLTKIIQAMQFDRESEVFIANVVKCRPPGNRVPEPDEMAACLPYLARQVEIIRPKVIVALGMTALRGLMADRLDPSVGITRLRGKWLDYRGVPVMPTFHPSYLLRSPDKKRFVWEDMQAVMAVFGKRHH